MLPKYLNAALRFIDFFPSAFLPFYLNRLDNRRYRFALRQFEIALSNSFPEDSIKGMDVF